MKNYLELLDTKITIKCIITVRPIADPVAPYCKIMFGRKVSFDGVLLSTTTITEEIQIDKPIRLHVQLLNKQYSHNQETAISIDRLDIDDVSIIPNYVGQASYVNDHDYSDPTTYLGFNGIWTFNIQPNFHIWLHQVDGKGWLLDKYSIKE